MDRPLPPELVLPEGWEAEWVSGINHVMIRCSVGMVTVDLHGRCYRAGMVTWGRPTSLATYAGRGWKKKLFTDAIAWLEKIVADVAKKRGRG